MHITRMSTAGALAAAALLVAPGIGSGAPAGVVQTIKAQDKLLMANPEFAELDHFQINSAAQARAQVPKLKALGTQINRAADAVAAASATAAQKAGQKDWVAGARDEATGVSDFGVTLEDALGRRTSAEKAELKKALKIVAAGDVLGSRGAKLLGIPKS